MKKIYSIIAVASLMLTSVFSLSSCQKDEMPATQAKTQVAQQPSVASNTGNSSSSQSGIVYMKVTDGDKTFDTTKKVDTSYAVGEWTATINGTAYTLVVSSNCSKYDINTEYKATLHVGDKSYDGIYMTPNFLYSGRFDSYALNANGNVAVAMMCPIVNESTLSEMTATYLDVNGDLILNDTGVKFVKK